MNNEAVLDKKIRTKKGGGNFHRPVVYVVDSKKSTP